MELLSFFIVLMAGVLFAAAFGRFHLPWVLALITAGITFGPHGFDIVEVNPTFSFIGEVGLILLMFMAGLETKLSSFREFKRDIVWLSFLNAAIPFLVGLTIGWIFNFEPIASFLLGMIFMSSSIAVVMPTLEAIGLMNVKLGKAIVSATIVEDVASLILLSLIIQSISPVTDLPLASFYFITALILVGFRYALPRIRDLIPHRRDEKDLFESEVRIIMAMLVGVVVTFELLGLHPIIAAFFTGLVLSDSVTSEILLDKIRTISYGVFIPIFFFLIGMETDIGVLVSSVSALALVLTIVFGSLISKFVSGWMGGRAAGFTRSEATVIGIATTPQLSTTLAVVFTAVELELLPSELITAMVMLSIVSTVVAPTFLRNYRPSAV